ncbi:MAG: DNA internalization-related competence protein ComEC/Rec2 [Eubacteriales bacterium]|nr:DNA internalization-related competence protein ComEC/Rec2 [Eubacteriales bacterium]
MKRPLMGILVGLVLGELCVCLPGPIGLIMPASLFFWIFLNRKFEKEQKPFFLFLLGLFFSIMAGYFTLTMEEIFVNRAECLVKKMEGEQATFEGKIIKQKMTSAGYMTFTLQSPRMIQEEKKAKIQGNITLTGKINEEECLPGDVIRAEGKIQALETATNPGGFDERKCSLANGVYATGFFEKVEKVKRPVFSFRRWAWQLKERVEQGYLENLASEDSAMLCAMIFGDKSYLTEEQKRIYEENGVAHLLAISGLHVSIVGGMIYRRFRKRGFSYRISCAAGVILLLFYGTMTGFGASASRAIVMYMIFLGGEYLGLSYDMISSLALAGILMLLEEPYRLFDGGFLISFASIFAIGAVVPFIFDQMESRETKVGKAKKAFLFSLIISMVTSPIILFFNYEITPYSIFWNLFLIPCMPALMVDGILAGVLGIFLGHYRILAFLAILILRIHHIFLKKVRFLPGSLILPGFPPWWKIFLYYGWGVIFCLLFWKGHKNKARLICFFMMILLVFPVKKPEMRITMLDVGQGDCILFQSQGKTLLLDGGSSTKKNVYRNIIEPALRYYGIASLDAVLVTHMDEDHLSGIREMLEEGYPIKQLFLSDTIENRQSDETAFHLQRYAKKQKAKVSFLKKGDRFTFGKMELSCLSPVVGQSFEEKNDSSLVMLAEYGKFRGLFTGDLGMEEEEKLLESRNTFPITVLKVAHHGSKYSTGQRFLAYFHPTIALISAGKGNRYGHPHNDLLNRLGEEKCHIFDTISSGAIVIEGKESLKVKQWKKRDFLTYPVF